MKNSGEQNISIKTSSVSKLNNYSIYNSLRNGGCNYFSASDYNSSCMADIYWENYVRKKERLFLSCSYLIFLAGVSGGSELSLVSGLLVKNARS